MLTKTWTKWLHKPLLYTGRASFARRVKPTLASYRMPDNKSIEQEDVEKLFDPHFITGVMEQKEFKKKMREERRKEIDLESMLEII